MFHASNGRLDAIISTPFRQEVASIIAVEALAVRILAMKKVHILTLCFAVAGMGFLANDLLRSDFDKFAKQTIRELGHRSDHQKATDALLSFLKEEEVDDPIAYFSRYTDSKSVVDADDPNLSEADRSYVRSGKVQNLTFFSSRYFNMLFTSYDFRIYVWDLRSGNRKITTQIYYNAP